VTLVEGWSFCVCTPGGDLNAAGPHGVFFRDTRILSRWDLRVDARIDLEVSADGAVVERAPHGVDVRHEWYWSHGAAAQT
jgi:hypothetical protein